MDKPKIKAEIKREWVKRLATTPVGMLARNRLIAYDGGPTGQPDRFCTVGHLLELYRQAHPGTTWGRVYLRIGPDDLIHKMGDNSIHMISPQFTEWAGIDYETGREMEAQCVYWNDGLGLSAQTIAVLIDELF